MYQPTAQFRVEPYGDPLRFYVTDNNGHPGENPWAEFDANLNVIRKGADYHEPTPEMIEVWKSYIAEKILPKFAQRHRWLEGEYYIRFGTLPRNGRSKNHLTGEYEAGVSCYAATYDIKDDCFRLTDDGTLAGAMLGHLLAGSTAYLITGKCVGTGSDGEPLLRKIKVLGKLIPNPKIEGFKLVKKEA